MNKKMVKVVSIVLVIVMSLSVIAMIWSLFA